MTTHAPRRLPLLIAALLVLGLVGLAPAGAATEACDSDAGREIVTADGFDLAFDAPGSTTPEFSNPPANHPAATALRTANFSLFTDFAPYRRAEMRVSLEWDEVSDYDVWIFDAAGNMVASSIESNIDGGTTSELALLTARTCRAYDIAVRSWAGSPTQELRLSVSFSKLAELDEELEPRDDARTFHYLGGDPGQVAMAHGAPNNVEQIPFRSALSEERPTGGRPNTYVRPPLGFNDYRNLLQAFFTRQLDAPRQITGDLAVQVWLSSPTMALEGHEGTIHITVFGDGSPLGQPFKLAGADVTAHPSPVLAVFPGVDRKVFETLTVQVSSEPVRSTSGHEEPLGNATFTLWYDSVQFPSRLTLP